MCPLALLVGFALGVLFRWFVEVGYEKREPLKEQDLPPVHPMCRCTPEPKQGKRADGVVELVIDKKTLYSDPNLKALFSHVEAGKHLAEKKVRRSRG
jgi:hypothetical protein